VALKPDVLAGLDSDTRGRLLAGMAASIAERGYAASTIADVVRHARVSKRTFYEHFSDKEAAYLTLYSVVSDRLLAVIAETAELDGTWRERIDAAATAYLAELAARPALTRTYLLEIQAAGPRALVARREIHGRFAALLRTLTQVAAEEDPSLRALSPAMATAVVGAVNELVLLAVEHDDIERLPELSGTATELLAALVAPPLTAHH
jgi:AcrR family transcriptional regulator